MKTRARGRRRRWLLLLILGIPLLLGILLLQPPVLKALLLPRLEQALEMDLDVATLRFSPLKQLELKGLRARSQDTSLELELGHADLHYDFWSLWGDSPSIRSLTLRNGDLLIRPEKIPKKTESETPAETENELPPKLKGLVMGPLVLENMHIRIEESGRKMELSQLNLEMGSFQFEGTHALRIHTDLQLEESAPLEQGQLTGRLEGELNMAWPLQLEGSLDFLRQEVSGRYDPLKDLGQARFSFQLKEEVIETFDLNLMDNRSQLLGRIQGSTPLNPLDSTQDMSLKIDRLGPETFLLLGGILGLEFGEPHLEGHLRGNWEDEVFTLEAAFQAQNLELKQQGEVLMTKTDYTVDLSASYNQASKNVILEELELGWTPETASENHLTLTGNLNLHHPQTPTGDLQLKADDLDLAALLSLAPQASPVNLQGLASIESRVHLDDTATKLEWTANLNTIGLAVSQGEILRLKPNDYQASLNAAYHLPSAKLDLSQLTLSWKPEPGYENEVEVKGVVILENRDAISGEIHLAGDAVNLDAVLPPPSPATPQEAASQNPESSATSFPFENFALRSRFGKLQLQEMALEDVRLDAQADETHLRLHPLAFRLNGSPVNAHLDLPKSLHLPEADGHLSIQELDLAPLVDAFAPAMKGRLEGRLTLSGSVSQAEPDRQRAGNLEATISKGRLFLLEEAPEGPKAVKMGQKLARLILESTARVLNVPPRRFTAPPIEDLRLEIDLKNSVLNVKEAHVANEEILLRSRGQIRLQPDPALTPLGNLQIQMGVSTNIAMRARIYRENRVEDDRVMLPPFLQLQGTLGEPELDVKKRVLTGLVLSGITDHNKIGGDDTQRILQGVGALLTGERLPPTPTPKPGEEPDSSEEPSTTEQILEGLNLFLKSRE